MKVFKELSLSLRIVVFLSIICLVSGCTCVVTGITINVVNNVSPIYNIFKAAALTELHFNKSEYLPEVEPISHHDIQLLADPCPEVNLDSIRKTFKPRLIEVPVKVPVLDTIFLDTLGNSAGREYITYLIEHSNKFKSLLPVDTILIQNLETYGSCDDMHLALFLMTKHNYYKLENLFQPIHLKE